MINIPAPKTMKCKNAQLLVDIFMTLPTDREGLARKYRDAYRVWENCKCTFCWMNMTSISGAAEKLSLDVIAELKKMEHEGDWHACTNPVKDDQFHPSQEGCKQGGMGELYDYWIDQIDGACHEYEDMPDPEAVKFALYAMTRIAFTELLAGCGCCACFHNAQIIGRHAKEKGVDMGRVLNEVKY